MSSIPLHPNAIRIRSAWWTLLAIILEASLWIIIAQLALLSWEASQSNSPWHVWLTTPSGRSLSIPWIATLLAVEASLNFVEWQIGQRSLIEEGTHKTFPFVWLPFGRLARLALMIALSTPILLIKLLIYFVWLTLLAPAAWVIGHKMGRGIDYVDHIWAPLEFWVNSVYNALHYCKINPRSSAFSSFFNLSLSMWCLNH